jgi:hypothetical protein
MRDRCGERARNKADGDISWANSRKGRNKTRCFAGYVGGSACNVSKRGKVGEHEEKRIANAIVKVDFRRCGAGEKVIAVSIHNTTTATGEWGGKKWNA